MNKYPFQFPNSLNKTTDVSILDLSYAPSQDIIILLRSDFCIELLRLQSRSNISIETVESIGIHVISQIYTKIAVFDSNKNAYKDNNKNKNDYKYQDKNENKIEYRKEDNNNNNNDDRNKNENENLNIDKNENENEIKLFASGSSRMIDVWKINTEKFSIFKLEKIGYLSEHSDVCRDVLVIHNKQFSILVSGGLDGNVLVRDVSTLNLRGKRFVDSL